MVEIQTCWTQNLSLIVLNETLRDMGRQPCTLLWDALDAAAKLCIIDRKQEKWLRFCNKRGNLSKHEPGWTSTKHPHA